jgi:SAM-dependent methyltransferase
MSGTRYRNGNVGLARFFDVQHNYAQLYRSYLTCGVNLTRARNEKELFYHNEEDDNYFERGADAIRLMVGELVRGLRKVPRTILDFPCGTGQVTRHLRAFFPNSRVCAWDLDDQHLNFCVNELGAEAIRSKKNFDELDFGLQFDLIFCGTLFSHLRENLLPPALRLLSRSLTEEGIAIVTLSGRHSENEIRSKFDERTSHVTTLVRPHGIVKLAEEDEQTRILGFAERGWDDDQDVLVIGRPPINDLDVYR